MEKDNACPGCGEEVEEDDLTALRVLGARFHREHFVCASCGETLAGRRFYEVGANKRTSVSVGPLALTSSAMCCSCYEAANDIPHCQCGCNEPLLGTYVKALGFSFLPDHFRCTHPQCSTSLVAGYMEANGRPVCENHWRANRRSLAGAPSPSSTASSTSSPTSSTRPGSDSGLASQLPSSRVDSLRESGGTPRSRSIGSAPSGGVPPRATPFASLPFAAEIDAVTAALRPVLAAIKVRNPGEVAPNLRSLVTSVKTLMASLRAMCINGDALASALKTASTKAVSQAKIVIRPAADDACWRAFSLDVLELGKEVRAARDSAVLTSGAGAGPARPVARNASDLPSRTHKAMLTAQTGAANAARRSRALAAAPKRGPLPKNFREYAEYHSLDISGFTKNQLACQEVIYEMIQTEEAYVLDLLILIDEFLTPLRELDIVSADDLDALFGNVEEILPLHREMWLQFKKRQKERKWVERVGDILSDKLRRILVVYTPYSSNHERALNTLESLTASSKKFRAFLQARFEDPKTKSLPLGSFLIKPIQRLCKYPLLLRELLRKMDAANDVDYAALVETADNLGTVVSRINEWKRTADNLNKLDVFFKGLEDPDGLLPPDLKIRNFITEGELNIGVIVPSAIKRNTMANSILKPRTEYAYLFAGLLVIVSRKRIRSTRVVTAAHDLDAMHLLDTPPLISDTFPHSIALTPLISTATASSVDTASVRRSRSSATPGDLVVLVFDSPHDRTPWLKAITTTMTERNESNPSPRLVAALAAAESLADETAEATTKAMAGMARSGRMGEELRGDLAFLATVAVARQPMAVIDALDTAARHAAGVGELRAQLAESALLVSAIGCESGTAHVAYSNAAAFHGSWLAHVRGHKVRVGHEHGGGEGGGGSGSGRGRADDLLVDPVATAAAGIPALSHSPEHSNPATSVLSFPLLKFFDLRPGLVSLSALVAVLGGAGVAMSEKLDGAIIKLTPRAADNSGLLIESQKTTLRHGHPMHRMLCEAVDLPALAARLEPGVTYVIELRHPELTTTVAADKPSAYLIAAVAHPPAYRMLNVATVASSIGLPIPRRLPLPPAAEVDDVVAAIEAESEPGFEGGVLAVESAAGEPLLLIKVKTAMWCALHDLGLASHDALLADLLVSQLHALAGDVGVAVRGLSPDLLAHGVARHLGPVLPARLGAAVANLGRALDRVDAAALICLDDSALHAHVARLDGMPPVVVTTIVKWARSMSAASGSAAPLPPLSRVFAREALAAGGIKHVLSLARAVLSIPSGLRTPSIAYPARCGRVLPQLTRAQAMSMYLVCREMTSAAADALVADVAFAGPDSGQLACYRRLQAWASSTLPPVALRPFGSFAVLGGALPVGSDIDLLTNTPLDELAPAIAAAFGDDLLQSRIVTDAAFPVLALEFAGGLLVDIVYDGSAWTIMDANTAVRAALIAAGSEADTVSRRTALVAFTRHMRRPGLLPSSMHAHMLFLGCCARIGLVPRADPTQTRVVHQWVGDVVAPFYEHAPPVLSSVTADGASASVSGPDAAALVVAVAAEVCAVLETGGEVSVLATTAMAAVGSGALGAGTNWASLAALRMQMTESVAAGAGEVVYVFDFDGTLFDETTAAASVAMPALLSRVVAAGAPVLVLTGRIQSELGPIYRILGKSGALRVPVFARRASRQSALNFKAEVLADLAAASVVDDSWQQIIHYDDIGKVLRVSGRMAAPCTVTPMLLVNCGKAPLRHFTPDLMASSTAQDGSGTTVVRVIVPGEPGVGKTTFLTKLCPALQEALGEEAVVTVLANDEIQATVGRATVARELKRRANEAVDAARAAGKTPVLVYDNRGASSLIHDASWLVLRLASTPSGYEVMDALAYLGVLDRPDHASDASSVEAATVSREAWLEYTTAVRKLHSRIRDGKYKHGDKVVAATEAAGGQVVSLGICDSAEAELALAEYAEPLATIKHLFSGRRKGNPMAGLSWGEQAAALASALDEVRGLHSRIYDADGLLDVAVSAVVDGVTHGGSARVNAAVVPWFRFAGLSLPTLSRAMCTWRATASGDSAWARAVAAAGGDSAALEADADARARIGFHVTLRYIAEATVGDVRALDETANAALADGVEVNAVELVAGRGIVCLAVALGGIEVDAGRRPHVTLATAPGVAARVSNDVLDALHRARRSRRGCA
ncbi:uncharacterized protein AMSG_08675 [Thecamonas trahens ATCC 50062]|uniref:DH domain-containing protein n=1 Tax=Thecamonas trahens ATCC 50062 TaxID=461836 RepID=A0A0L0DL75_THETB|nr:hypothetical protein AMSG_08675 [Thecamonas trahens ATCC 50062]KNC52786.1 hypothetical protein AMSG_08675 [Thecamonas trahens ATCC 50062]|eukprot:XP_013755096.1 hypothetical protein AMSG_08675 [Thecamonas trahens ATCC 50062]